MLERLRSFFLPPTFESDEKTREAHLAYLVAWLFVILPAAYGLFRLLSETRSTSAVLPLALFGVSAISGVILVMIHRGSVKVASWLLVIASWIGFLLLSWNLGGVRDASYAGLILVIVLAGLLLGGTASAVVVAFSVLLGWFLVDAEVSGILPADYDAPADVLASFVAIFTMAAGLVAVASQGFRRLLTRIRQNERQLEIRNRQLQAMRESLEQRVAERTLDLDKRSRYLEAAAEVAYAAGQILDVEDLMRESVDLIRDTFDLYYVGLFLVDGARDYAVLRAGTGEAGRTMLAREHRIRVGQGMVGWAIENNQSRVAQHAEEDRVRLVMSELPETRAEAALPLRARGNVIGALTVQSVVPDYFNEATVTTLQTMADLLAIALNNAELFEERERAMAAVRRAYGEIATQAWDELLRAQDDWGYRYTDGIVRPSDQISETVQEALRRGEPVYDLEQRASEVAIPLRVGGETIGAIGYRRRAEEGAWEEEDVAFLSALTEQLSQALDSARLLDESRKTAALEQAIVQVTSRIRAEVEIEAVLERTLAELGAVLEADQGHALLTIDAASGEETR